MKVRLGTIEVSDEVRRAIRWRIGEPGLATRKEVRNLMNSYANADLDVLMQDYRQEAHKSASAS